jgi:solute carrier family 25 folate transporter 32
MSFDRNPVSPIAAQDTGNGSSNPPRTRLGDWAKRIPEGYVVPVSGGLAGAVSGLVSCPLDVIKTKLQAQGGFRATKDEIKITTAAYRGVHGTAVTIWREDGLRGMYRGLGPMLLGYVPTWAVYLTVYNKSQGYFRTKTGGPFPMLPSERCLINNCLDNWFLANVYASLTGGACSTFATNPIWVIKTRLMSQSSTKNVTNHSTPPWHYKNTWDAAHMMYRNEGILSFYSGLTPALLGLTHVAIQFPLYEIFKEKFTGIGKGQKESDEDRSHHFYGLAMAVFLSKVCASTATYPHEVVRTRLQTQQRSATSSASQGLSPREGLKNPPDHGRPPGVISPGIRGLRYRGTVQTCKTILLEEGWKGFYAGLGTNLIRAVPSAMTTILTFEYLKKTFLQMQHEGNTGDGVLGQTVS